jgi:hypothetical protein
MRVRTFAWALTVATSAKTASTAAVELLGLVAEILTPQPGEILILADLEHLAAELFDHVQLHTPFDLLVPMKNTRPLRKQLRAIPAEQFARRWAGFATAKLSYQMARSSVPLRGRTSFVLARQASRDLGAEITTAQFEAAKLDYGQLSHPEYLAIRTHSPALVHLGPIGKRW